MLHKEWISVVLGLESSPTSAVVFVPAWHCLDSIAELIQVLPGHLDIVIDIGDGNWTFEVPNETNTLRSLNS